MHGNHKRMRRQSTLRRLYRILMLINVVATVLSLAILPFLRAMSTCVLLFGTLALLTGLMYVLVYMRDFGRAKVAIPARICVLIGNALLAVWALSFLLIQGCILLGSRTNADPTQVDYVLVLGCGLREDVPSTTLLERLEAANEILYKNPNCTLILSGGQGTDEDLPESEAMYTWLAENGADISRVIEEDQSLDTEQNVQNSADVLSQIGASSNSCAVLTSDFHLYRARKIMEQHGLPGLGFAAKCKNPLLGLCFRIREYFSIVLWRFGL